jgi:hypothetical protein
MERLETLRPGASIDEVRRSEAVVFVEYKLRQFPYEESLASLRNPLLRLDAPLHVILSRDEGQVVAECPEFEEFGYGANSSEAIKDLQDTIVELYFTLKDEQARLGGRLPELWDKVKAKIKER